MTHLSGSGGPIDPWIERRLAAALVWVLVVWVALLGRLFWLQVLQGDRYQISAERNSIRTHRMAAPRGMILDRNREILVDSRPSFDVLLVPHEVSAPGETLGRLARLTGVTLEVLVRTLGEPTGRQRFVPQRVVRDLGRDALARVEARQWALDGVVTQATPIRSYRYGESAAHVLGWLGETDKEQLRLRKYQGYRRGDVIGRDGIERLLDRELRGRDGGRNVLVDAHGRELRGIDAVAPQPGQNVVLTLDHRLQQVAEQALAETEKRGSVVALDPRNGEVLVLANRPSFEPNLFAVGIDHASWKALSEDPGTPLHNRALQGQYPPGSTYKIVTALAGLEAGVITDDFRVDCAGSYRLGRRRYRCWRRGGHGEVDLHRALVESCDVFFYRVGEELGVDRLAYYARTLGLGSPTGIELLGETPGLVPTSEWKRRRFAEPWLKGETLSTAIGQGFNLWTPIQLASAYAVLANGGTRYRPYVVRRVEDVDGSLIRESEPEIAGEVAISKRSVARVRAALRGVVHDERGTGWVMRRLPFGVEAAGKTGTAQVVALARGPAVDEEDLPEAHRDHAWFVAWAPAERARITVAVLVEHGGHGASTAAPIARRVIAAFLENELADAGEGEAELHARN